MTPSQLQRIKDLFLAASELPAEERLAFLDRQPEVDAEVRRWVEEQLHELGRDAECGLPMPWQDAVALPQAGQSIGRYKLLEQIGEGGFGIVWMAEQQEPVRRMVALKVIKLGMDTVQVVARFEAERQALAMMNHANIAQVFDGGATPEGRPYFVMELVKGIAIDEYCEQAELGTEERLALFVQVCQAVQHAHQKGVIHRDLKPSNVLVTVSDDVAVPKVIDFGIAKATSAELTQRTLFTGFRQMVGTPEYMAPEQAAFADRDVDTRADVYSLGVMLYELLTGQKPFDAEQLLRRGYDEMLRVIREVDPPKPSTRVSDIGDATAVVAKRRQITSKQLSRQIRGDLDCIVMRALEKQRDRRYDSAEALAGDIARHLQHQPVLAGPPTITYRLTKYLRRHGVLVAAVATVLLAVLIGAGLAVSYALDANVERQATAAARDGLTGLVQILKGSDPFLSDDTNEYPLRSLDLAAEQVSRAFAGQPRREADVRKSLGASYWRLGALHQALREMDIAADLLLGLPDVTAAELRSLLQPRFLMSQHVSPSREAEWQQLHRLQGAWFELISAGNAELETKARSLLSWARAWRYPIDQDAAEELRLQIEVALQDEPPGSARWTALGDFVWYCGGCLGNTQDQYAQGVEWMDHADRIYGERARLPKSHMQRVLLAVHRLQLILRSDEAGALRIDADEHFEGLQLALPQGHWLRDVSVCWQAIAHLRSAPGDAETMARLRERYAEVARVLGAKNLHTRALLCGLILASEAAGVPDTQRLRDSLAASFGGDGLVPNLVTLAAAVGEHPVMDPLRALQELWQAGEWSQDYRADVRTSVTAVIRHCADLDESRRMAIACWLRERCGQHLEKYGGDAAPREDLQQLYGFLESVISEQDGVIWCRLQADISNMHLFVDGDMQLAGQYARASVPVDVDGRAVRNGDPWSHVVLGKMLSLSGNEEEGLANLREAYQRFQSCSLPVDLHHDFACRNLIRGLVKAGEARGDVASSLREAAAIALLHLNDLLRGGACSDALNQAAWAIARVQGLPQTTYERARAAMIVAEAQLQRWGVPHPELPVYSANTMACLALRTERWQEAAVHAQRAIALRAEHDQKESLLDYAFLAMAQHSCGDRAAASVSIARARAIYDAQLIAGEAGEPAELVKMLLAEAVAHVRD